jgi:hypothetical protein
VEERKERKGGMKEGRKEEEEEEECKGMAEIEKKYEVVGIVRMVVKGKIYK